MSSLSGTRWTEEARAVDIAEAAFRVGAKLKKATTTEWVGPCPACGGRDRFSVNIPEQIFNCRPMGGGDAIAMVRHVLGVDFKEAVDFLVGKDTTGRPQLRELLPAQVAQKPPGAADDERRRIHRAGAIWDEALDPRGTIVEKPYLAGRALSLSEDLAGRVIRFHPRCPWREGESTIFVPAMVCAMRSIAIDEITAVHRTRLSPEGVKLDRRMLGVVAGSAIKLDADDTVTHGLHISEGIETAMAARQLGLKPTWALGSTTFIAAFPVLSGIECLTLLGENDTASAKAVEACAARWHAGGRMVLINKPARGNDLNDAIRGPG